MTGPRRGRVHWRFSEAEIEWLSANRMMRLCEYHRAFCAAFPQREITASQLNDQRKTKWPNGRKGGFAKGYTPHNKKPVGYERVLKRPGSSSAIAMLIEERMPDGSIRRRYVNKARWLWEKANGPIPPHHVLKCKGDFRNTDPDNFELVAPEMLPRLTGAYGSVSYHDAPAELKPAIMTVAKIEYAITKRSRREKQDAA